MNITEQAARVLREIDEKLALAEKATPGPWEHTIVGGIWLARNLATQPIRIEDAAFIAESRTGYPLALACLKTAIEGLLCVQQQQHHYTMAERAAKTLATLCDQWDSRK